MHGKNLPGLRVHFVSFYKVSAETVRVIGALALAPMQRLAGVVLVVRFLA